MPPLINNKTGLDTQVQHIGVLMEKFDTSIYPNFQLPPGYQFISYKKGIEKDWARLQLEVGQVDTIEEAEAAFQKEFLDGKSMNWINREYTPLVTSEIEKSPCYDELMKKVVFVINQSGALTATGCIWNGWMFGEDRIRLHWIAVSPNHQGKGICKALITKLLDRYNELGYSGYLHLTSQTWSYRALNIYMKFGFKPYMGEKPKNWLAVNVASGNFEPWDYEQKNKEAWDIIYSKINEYKSITMASYQEI